MFRQGCCSCILLVQSNTLRQNLIPERFLFRWTFLDSESKIYGFSSKKSWKFCQKWLYVSRRTMFVAGSFRKISCAYLYSDFAKKNLTSPEEFLGRLLPQNLAIPGKRLRQNYIFWKFMYFSSIFPTLSQNITELCQKFSWKHWLNCFLSEQVKFWSTFVERSITKGSFSRLLVEKKIFWQKTFSRVMAGAVYLLGRLCWDEIEFLEIKLKIYFRFWAKQFLNLSTNFRQLCQKCPTRIQRNIFKKIFSRERISFWVFWKMNKKKAGFLAVIFPQRCSICILRARGMFWGKNVFAK